MPDFKMMDAQAALGFVVSQRTHIETEVVKKEYPEINYAKMIPVDTSANAFVASVTFFTRDSVGKAKFISGKGDDVPLVNVLGSKFEQTINTAGIGYEFSLEEIGAAQQIGQNLSGDGADAAREAYEHLVDDVAFVGDTDLAVEGLYNMTGITSIAAAKTFALSTPQEVLATINGALTSIMTATKGLSGHIADTIVMPLAQWGDIATRQLSPESSMTILEFIQKSNVYTARTGQPLTILADHRLTAKMVVYRRDPKVLKLHMPMPLRFIAPQSIGLAIKVLGMFRFSPVNIRLPGAFRYVTGI